MPLIRHKGGLLLVDGKIANSVDCCCGDPPDPPPPIFECAPVPMPYALHLTVTSHSGCICASGLDIILSYKEDVDGAGNKGYEWSGQFGTCLGSTITTRFRVVCTFFSWYLETFMQCQGAFVNLSNILAGTTYEPFQASAFIYNIKRCCSSGTFGEASLNVIITE